MTFKPGTPFKRSGNVWICLSAISSALTTVMLLATCTSGVGMRVAVTTMVSGPSSAAAPATVGHAKGMDAARARIDLRTRFSWNGGQEPARGSALTLNFQDKAP